MESLSPESRWDGGLELCSHVAGGRSPTQSSVHPSIHDADRSSSSENGYYTADGGSGPELLATTLEDDERDLVDAVRSQRDLAMPSTASPVSHLPWDRKPALVADAYNSFDLPHGHMKEDSTSHKARRVHHGQIDNHVHFISEVQMIRRHRQKVQALRIQARDERNRMKHTRNCLNRAFRDFLKANETISLQRGDHDNATASLIEMDATFKELEAQDVDLDVVESSLVPAEWELKEAEQRLYEDILGPSASGENDSEISIHLTRATPRRLCSRPDERDINLSLLAPCESTTQERLSAMTCHKDQVMNRLMSLTKEYAALQEDVQMRTAVGLPVDEFSQEALEAFPKRRAQLLRELADLTTGLNILNDMVTEGLGLMSRESDALFGHDQFDDLKTDMITQQSLTEGDEVLHLQAHDYEERNNDILPFLSQPVVDALSYSRSLQGQSFGSPLAQYSSVAWDLRGRDAETISVFVSMWILGCVQSSWWSLVRFVFMSRLDGKFSTETVDDYMKTTWFQDSADCTPQMDASEDPEDSDFSFTVGDEVLTPLSGATDGHELQWQNRPLKRRHSSGHSTATTHRKLSNHIRPNAG